MVDAAHPDGAGQPIFRLIYRSQSRLVEDERSRELGAIFTIARRHNRDLGITGALMISDDTFVQALEGDEDEVRDLFAAIETDARHDHVVVVEETTTPRTFGRWAMAKVAADGGPDIRLLSNARQGRIVAAPRDPSISPAQEKVLTFMRGAASGDGLGT